MTQLSFALKSQLFCTESNSLNPLTYIEHALEKVLPRHLIFLLWKQSPTQMPALLFLLSQEGLAVANEIADITQVQRVYALLPCCPSKLSDFYPEQKLEKFADPTTVALRQPFPSKVVCPTSCVCSVCCV